MPNGSATFLTPWPFTMQSELLGHFRQRKITSETFSGHLNRTTEDAYGCCVLVAKATKITTRSQILKLFIFSLFVKCLFFFGNLLLKVYFVNIYKAE